MNRDLGEGLDEGDAVLRKADESLSSRERICRVCQCDGKDPADRRLLADVARRVGCALRKVRAQGTVSGERDRSGAATWGVAKVPNS